MTERPKMVAFALGMAVGTLIGYLAGFGIVHL